MYGDKSNAGCSCSYTRRSYGARTPVCVFLELEKRTGERTLWSCLVPTTCTFCAGNATAPLRVEDERNAAVSLHDNIDGTI